VSAADLCFENVNYAPANLLVLLVLSLSLSGVSVVLSRCRSRLPAGAPGKVRWTRGGLPAGRRLLQLFHFIGRALMPTRRTPKIAHAASQKHLLRKFSRGCKLTRFWLCSRIKVSRSARCMEFQMRHVMCVPLVSGVLGQGAVFLYASCKNSIKLVQLETHY
jgi:hypothetical protein